MFDHDKADFLREDALQPTQFAQTHLQMVKQIGHFKMKESYIQHFDEIKEQQYLVLYVNGGNAILVDGREYHALCGSATLIKRMYQPFSVFLDECEGYYAVLEGMDIDQYIREDTIIMDLRFSKKTEIFFHSVFQSLDKYHLVDEFSISSSVLRLYADLHIERHVLKSWSSKQDVIDKALTFMEENYQRDIKLKDISEATGYSEYYFLRIFKEIMLMTPYEYLIRKRLSQVKILLLSTTKTIEEIALLSGFKSDVSLYKTFKNTYSITPGEYKKTIGK